MIWNNLETSLNSSTDQVPDSVTIFCGVSFEQFNIVSEADIREISSSPPKSCALDPIPHYPVLNCQLKCRTLFLTPFIKKIVIECEIVNNCKPVSNLSFISKLVQRVVCVQLVEHLKTNTLHEIFQSAYRQLHGTKTASFVYKMTYSKPLTIREEPF